MKSFGVALLAAGGLMLEIGLTRLFSTLYYPPYVFVVLSLAVLGIGLGAGLVAWRPALARAELIPWYAGGASVTALLVTAFLLTWPDLGGGAIQFGLTALPFLGLGMTLSALFSLDAAHSPAYYRADLVGAGVGAALTLPLLDTVGVVNGLVAAALLPALAGLLLAGTLRTPVTVVAAAGAALLLVNIARPVLALDWARAPTAKPVLDSLAGSGRLLASTWDSFARTDLVDPGDGRPYELYMDGAAGSVMPPAAGDPALWRDIGLFPFATEQPSHVFIIGPGGGADVWFAVQGRAEEIVAVEVNAASVDMVRAFGDYNGDLYARPDVRVVVDEGRHVLTREDAAYDLIFLSHVLTQAAERTGFTLVENRALTVEAFATYLEHLRPGGQLALKLYDEPTLTRALATALTVLRGQGMDDAQALQHVMVFLDGAADPAVPLLLVRNAPFTRDDSLSLGAVARQVGFTPLFLPQVLADPPLDAVVSGAQTFAAVLAASDGNLAPTTDDRPFFYLFEPGLPSQLRRLLWALLAVVVVGIAGVIRMQRRLAPEARFPGHPSTSARWAWASCWWRSPSSSRPRVCSAIRPGRDGGAGRAAGHGRCGQRGARRACPRCAWAPAAVALAVVAWLLPWPLPAPRAIGGRAAARSGDVAGTCARGVFMGAPFPLGLRQVGAVDRRQVALAECQRRHERGRLRGGRGVGCNVRLSCRSAGGGGALSRGCAAVRLVHARGRL
ncbi:MAG: hypothetical protein R2851_15100 [Caldilineaceae bacterium]